MENLQQEAAPRKSNRRTQLRAAGIWLGFGVLLAAGIPWYLPLSTEKMFLGLPLWVDICLFGNLLLAVYTYLVIRVLWK